jgi:ferritin
MLMISKKMVKALSTQVNAEMYSSYLYLSMSSYATSLGRKGAAAWLRLQAKEEMTHAMKMYEYLVSQGEIATFGAIAQPPAKFDSLQGIFREVLKHEKKVTAMIHKLTELAKAEKDYATEIFLQWFVSEQVEEEEHATEIVDGFKLIGDSPGSLFMMDKQLGKRAAG